ncbi:phage tail protein [Bacillus thuringiensis serovar brasilensis]|uniref:phage tail protein n=1 Tax=Bacillus cereus group TaxID=86661 RepID=UPI000A36EE95|nr:phage tail protein [Bacillus thuringiensis]MCU5028583.1 phage tail family protein [Bacillus cereus]MRA71921.1 phage tail protein [Bacillus thuringiensis]MRA91195.1 phage tail protein [Bacillus thuringiensis]MRC53412.1 phage tail protein [Bacillus thuringiensis]OTX29670.1 phage tail protein [Bacillus thuringiensis serovar brasilensis]
MYGINFNGRHSYSDMGYTMPADGRDIGFPSKEKIVVKVPFSNVEYDFSEIYGSQTYTSRPLKYTFNVLKRGNWTPQALHMEKTKLINWIMNSGGRQKLYDDDIPGYYFLAEVESESSFEDDFETGTLSVTFRAYPFMIAELYEGNDIWDTFSFDLDVAQTTEFTVNGTLRVTLLNVGTPDVTPEIKTSNQMKITKDGVTYTAHAGVTKDKNFVLKSGENVLGITGNGTISFRFYKELI